MPSALHESYVSWLASHFTRVHMTDKEIPLDLCPHKPTNKRGCRPDVVGLYRQRLAHGEVDCASSRGPCAYEIIDAHTGRTMARGACPTVATTHAPRR